MTRIYIKIILFVKFSLISLLLIGYLKRQLMLGIIVILIEEKTKMLIMRVKNCERKSIKVIRMQS